MAYAEAMKVQRQAFQLELDKVREKLELVELRSETITGELWFLKVMKVTRDERPAKNTSAENNILTANKNKTEGEEEIRQAQDPGRTTNTLIEKR